jgi:hypothetical protein
MKGRIRSVRMIVVLIAAAALTSCLGLEIEMRFTDDGSGTMQMKLTVSKALVEMGADAADSGLDAPLSAEAVREQFAGIEGVELVAVTEEDTGDDLVITASIAFDSLEALLVADDSPVGTAVYRREGSRTIYEMAFGDAMSAMNPDELGLDGAEIDEAMIAMVEAFLEGYFMEYRITAPRRIVDHTHGELDSTGRTVTLRMPMAEYFTIDEPYTFHVEW